MGDKTIVEEVKDVVVSATVDPVAQTVAFTCCGWRVSLHKVQTPKDPAPPKTEETVSKDSTTTAPSAPETV